MKIEFDLVDRGEWMGSERYRVEVSVTTPEATIVRDMRIQGKTAEAALADLVEALEWAQKGSCL